MREIEVEPFKSHYEGVQDTVSNAAVEGSNIGNAEKTAGENVNKSIEFIPENDTKIYTLSYNREFLSILG